MKRILMIALIAVTAIACNKNQKAVKKLDGTWKVTQLIITQDAFSVTQTDLDLTMTFHNCKLKNNEYCSLTTTLIDDSVTKTSSMFYKVTSDGTILITADDTAGSENESMTIVELSKSQLTLQQTDGDLMFDLKLEKQ